MSLFSDSLKKWFYHNDSNAAKAGTRICLLDASGDPAGSDELLRSLSFAQCPDDFVDMGLPSGTLWAKKNLGAVSETDYGMYVSWGNLELHSKGEGYDFSQNTYDNTPAAPISADLTLEHDIAHNILGCGWRMPTKNEFAELCNSSYTEYIDANGTVITGTDKRTTYNGVTGLLIRSKANGNVLFFPAAGYYSGTTLNYDGSIGYYWSSSFYSATNAYLLYFTSNGVYPQHNLSRSFGFSVRAVL